MLAIAVSLLFGLAACAALGVLASSLTSASRRIAPMLAELAAIDRAARVSRPRPARLQRRIALPALAVA